MFNVLVLGGLALVGCGGSVATERGEDNRQAGDAASGRGGTAANGAAVGEAGAQDAARPSALSPRDAGYIGFPNEAPPPPPPPPAEDASSSDVSSALDGYADATVGLPPCGGVPCEAPQ
ncbi:MAG: hypothetical protein ACREOE_05780 [Gemmatimonadales bacterium]